MPEKQLIEINPTKLTIDNQTFRKLHSNSHHEIRQMDRRRQHLRGGRNQKACEKIILLILVIHLDPKHKSTLNPTILRIWGLALSKVKMKNWQKLRNSPTSLNETFQGKDLNRARELRVQIREIVHDR